MADSPPGLSRGAVLPHQDNAGNISGIGVPAVTVPSRAAAWGSGSSPGWRGRRLLKSSCRSRPRGWWPGRPGRFPWRPSAGWRPGRRSRRFSGAEASSHGGSRRRIGGLTRRTDPSGGRYGRLQANRRHVDSSLAVAPAAGRCAGFSDTGHVGHGMPPGGRIAWLVPSGRGPASRLRDRTVMVRWRRVDHGHSGPAAGGPRWALGRTVPNHFAVLSGDAGAPLHAIRIAAGTQIDPPERQPGCPDRPAVGASGRVISDMGPLPLVLDKGLNGSVGGFLSWRGRRLRSCKTQIARTDW